MNGGGGNCNKINLFYHRYDENGEINEQAKWVDEFWLITKIRNFYEKLFY
jgi:hypothetical protein